MEELFVSILKDGGEVKVLNRDVRIVLPNTMPRIKLFRLAMQVQDLMSQSSQLFISYNQVFSQDETIIIEGELLAEE